MKDHTPSPDTEQETKKEIKLCAIVPGYTETTSKIAKALLKGYAMEYCWGYKGLEHESKLTREEIKPFIEAMKKLGFVKAYRGLMDDDGMVAGSGFGITSNEAAHLMELGLYRYKYGDEL